MSKIISLSEAVSIAMHGMVLISKSQKLINVQDIATATDSSKHHVAKVMQRLVKANQLTSQRGPTGGFMLNKKPKSITLRDIWEAVEGKIEIADCVLNKPTCPFTACIFDNITRTLSEQFVDFLQNKTLDQYSDI
jgi:Rrf2 family protein